MDLDRSTVSILVVEDEALPRLDLVETLSEAGYEVLEAADAHQALSYLRNRRPIDVVITDIDLGGGPTGYGMSRRLSGRHARIPHHLHLRRCR